MADQNRDRSNQDNPQSQHGGRTHDEEQSSGMGQSRSRSTREPGARADDRGRGESRQQGDDTDELDRDLGVESDLDEMDDLDDIDEGDRSER